MALAQHPALNVHLIQVVIPQPQPSYECATYTLHPTSYTLHPEPYTLHPAP